jgi:hypothetical protein
MVMSRPELSLQLDPEPQDRVWLVRCETCPAFADFLRGEGTDRCVPRAQHRTARAAAVYVAVVYSEVTRRDRCVSWKKTGRFDENGAEFLVSPRVGPRVIDLL